MKRPARVYHVARCDTSEDACEAAALARAARVLRDPIIVEAHNCGIARDGIALVQYVMEEAQR